MIYKLFTPYYFMKYSRIALPILLPFCFGFFIFGLYYALVASPPDYQQGEMVRLMYIHVPSAWMSLGIFTFMALCSLSVLVWKANFAFILAVAAAPIGACFALLTLVTGSIWGKPIWGAWWVWDARLTSMLVLFLLYLCYIVVASSGSYMMRAAKPASIIAIIGFINVPIVKFSVDMWNSLHQPASILRSGGPAIDILMLKPLFIMFVAFILYFALVLILRCHKIMYNVKNNK